MATCAKAALLRSMSSRFGRCRHLACWAPPAKHLAPSPPAPILPCRPAGRSPRLGFEGGQTPLRMRVPLRGFRNPHTRFYR